MTGQQQVAVSAKPVAMAFYNSDGYKNAADLALRFAGDGGRLATMPDIVDARLTKKPESFEWGRYFTTNTAEYIGRSKQGVPLVAVIHGAGPLAQPESMTRIYAQSYTYNEGRPPRITKRDFQRLIAGHFGPVEVMELREVTERYEYPFMEQLTFEQACDDPLVRARLGARAIEYLTYHRDFSREWFQQEHPGKEPNSYILQSGGGTNYFRAEERSERPYGHILSTSSLQNLHHQHGISLTSEIGPHDKGNGVRVVGVRAERRQVDAIHRGPEDLTNNPVKYWPQLMVPADPDAQIVEPYTLTQLGNTWFAEYREADHVMESGEGEYLVTSMRRIAGPETIVVPILGYHGFFKYELDSVREILPEGANAFYIGEPTNIWENGNPEKQSAPIAFYQATIDPTRRLLRTAEIQNNLDLVLSLL